MLETLFSSRVRVKLLEAFLTNPSAQFHSRELARLVKERQNAVWRELRRLEEAGLLESTARGNRKDYRVSVQHPLYPELRRLMLKARGAQPEPSPKQGVHERYRMPDCCVACAPSYIIGEND
jgi:predicted transcriptional regulator